MLEKIVNDMKEAQKGGEKIRLSALRLLKAALKNREIEKRGLPGQPMLTDEDVLKVIAQLAKQRRESIEMFEKGGRQDLVENEKTELSVLESYLPRQMSRSDLEQLVDEVMKEVAASGPNDIGKVMKAIMPKVAGRADGKEVNSVVRAKLGGSAS